MRRTLALIAALAILLTAVSPAFAGRRWSKELPEVTDSAPNGSCASILPDYGQAGVTELSMEYLTNDVTGSSAVIDGAQDLYNCTGPDLLHGASAWVAIQPNWGANNILQIGVINCYDPGIYGGGSSEEPACYGGHQLHNNIFFAWGRDDSCSAGGHTPYPMYIAPAPSGPVRYTVYWDKGLNVIQFIYVTSDNVTHYARTLSASSFTSCWLGQDSNQPAYYAERTDVGDGMGAVGNHLIFSGAKAGIYNTGWLDTNFTSSEVFKDGLESNEFSVSLSSGPTTINVWTLQQ